MFYNQFKSFNGFMVIVEGQGVVIRDGSDLRVIFIVFVEYKEGV